ncbi:MAG: hypothetical protein SFV54_09020 [Bryobacteraceae bacterium]|nr:hypothetical protein [Bryobacteraceae bacterium]
MRVAFILFTTVLAAWAEDAREIVRRSVERDVFNSEKTKDYTYIQRQETRKLNGKNAVTDTDSETFDVLLIEGQPYRRLIERNGKPLSESERLKEEKKFDKTLAERRAQSPAERNKRLAEVEKQRREGREFLKEVPDAYAFRLVGEQSLEGRDVWVIEAEPRKDYKPRSRRGGLLMKFRGKLWISKGDYQWVRAEAEPIDTVSFGLFLARLGTGSKVEFQLMEVNNEVWLPRSVRVRVDARVALLKRYHAEQDIDFRNYRKFQTDSRVVSSEEISRQP